MGTVYWCVAMALGGWLWMRLNRRLLGDSFSPLSILLFSWVGPLALTMLRLSGLQRSWSLEVWMIIGWTTFVLVGTSAAAATRLAPGAPFSGVDLRPLWDEWSSPHLLKVLLSLYVIGFCAYLYNEFITNPIGIPAIAYASNPLLSREAYHRWGKEGGTSPAGLVSILAPLLLPSLYLASHNVKSPRLRKAIWFAIAAYPTMALLKLSRIDVLTSTVALGMAEYYRRAAMRRIRPVKQRAPGQRRRRQLVLLALVLAVAPLSNVFLKLRSNIEVAESYFERQLAIRTELPPVLQGFVLEGYSYFALPFENLADWVPNYTGPDVPGVGMLRPIYSILGAGRDMDAHTSAAIGDYRLWPINTYPFITLPYFEFGALSIVLVPIFVAVLVNFFYVRARAVPTALTLALYINCMFGWILLFSANGFSVLTFYLNIAALIAVYTFARLLAVFSQRYAAVNTGTNVRA